MNVKSAVHRLIDPLQKEQKLLMTKPRFALADHHPFQNIQGGE